MFIGDDFMIDKKILNEYKKLSNYTKNNLYNFSVFNSCYNYDPNMSDDLALRIFALTHECWLKSSTTDIENYAEYILSAIYEYGGTIEEIENNNVKHIIELYNNELSSKELLIYKTDGLEYCFTTFNNDKYYSSEDGFIVLNKDGRKIADPCAMEYSPNVFFELLNEHKIKDISNEMHYNVREYRKSCVNRKTFRYDKIRKGRF